jgi:hypothetical protein
MKKHGMGGAGGKRWGEVKRIQSLVRGRDHLEGPGLCGKINIKMDLQEVAWGMDRIDLVQDREKRWAVMCVVMNLRVP